MKYDFELDLVHNNSLSWIVEQIESNSIVLEFGPANGRLTRYLKEQLNCKVYLAELDEEAGKQALQYGEDLVIGDIEDYEWLTRYQDIRFDYLICADVLEHLRNPEEVLARAKHLLKPEGSVVLTVPNLAHNSVIIDLLNNKFEYRDIGLLDNTHIHFFTKESLEKMIVNTGLTVSKRYATYSPVGTNEFNNTINDIPEIDASYWINRKYGEIYQFVYVAKKGREFIEEECNNLISFNNNFYFAQLFFGGNTFDENDSISKKLCLSNNSISFVFDNISHGKTMRFDPLNSSCIIEIKELKAIINGEIKELDIIDSNASYHAGDVYIFNCDDPNMIIDTDFEDDIDSLVIGVNYITFNKSQLSNLCNALERTININEVRKSTIHDKDVHISNLEYIIEELKDDCKKLKEDCEKLNTDCEEKCGEAYQYESENSKLREENVKLLGENDGLRAAYMAKDALLDEIMHSKRWKYMEIIRKLRHKS